MATVFDDIRYELRRLWKSPGFMAVAVLTLALGIAVNATMFSLVSAILLRRPPGRDPERVVVISSVNPAQVFHADAFPVSVPNYLAWREANRVFSEMAANDDGQTVSLGEAEGAEAIHADRVSPNYFALLGLSPQLGRSFSKNEDQPGRDHVLILSHDLWQRRFGSDPSILGRTVRLNRENWVVIGVMPADFRLLGYTPQLWMPLVLEPADQTAAARNLRSLRVFARLKSGVTLAEARAELVTLAGRAQEDFPEVEKGWGAAVRTLPDFLIYDFGIRAGLAVMMAAVGFVLMIACANVAGLLLARAAGRQKELSIRMSLGARRRDIVRQLLAEGLLIALLGGVLGLVLATWGVDFVRANLRFNEAISAVPVSLDRNVLLFALAASLASALLSSLAPALKASRADVRTALEDQSRGSSSGRTHNRLRKILVTGEIALTLFLLVGAGLLIRGIYLLEHQNLGFQPDHLLTANLTLDKARYKDAPEQGLLVQDLISRLQPLPGVEAVAAASDLPATGPDSVPLRIEGQPEIAASQRPRALDVVVTPGYFRAAGIPLLRGRTFTPRDNPTAPPVVLVNQEFVHRYLRDEEALGKQVRLDVSGAKEQWSEIVGVVGDVKTYSEEPRVDPEVYESLLQRPAASFSLMLRTDSDPSALASTLRRTVSHADRELPLAQVMSMSAVIERQKGGDRFFVHVLASFALLALILAAIGIYGLIAYSVGCRIPEIGIRMALGARSTDVVRMIMREGLVIGAVGASLGVAAAMPLPKVFAALFQGLQWREPGLYLLMPAAILLVATLATYIPARRAARVDPMVALRYQ